MDILVGNAAEALAISDAITALSCPGLICEACHGTQDTMLTTTSPQESADPDCHQGGPNAGWGHISYLPGQPQPPESTTKQKALALAG